MKHLLLLLALATLTACGRSSSRVPGGNPNETALLEVKGMTCESCVQGISGMLQQLPGIAEFSVSLEEESAQVSYDAKALSPDQIAAAINRLGFQAAVLVPSPE